ncbi:hypothetical protein ATM97_01885 [Nocardia sp. MH4]|jgi:hypothetical protein|uniref:hypothetical protein n=1 Tax=Nocardia TaxID=1817 RepID=UPI001C4F653E|nr:MULTISPECIES: hypothetical protein [Nocardia]MBW0269902.1 hypothetical protein [Nocardia sp. MH4]
MAESPYSDLLGKTRAGEVYLNDDAAAYHMYKACDKRLTDLDSLRAVAIRAQAVSGFGDFDMARQLEKQFLRQATGDDNSVDAVIMKDIEAVKQLREVFSLSFKRLTGQDIENADALDYTTEQVK